MGSIPSVVKFFFLGESFAVSGQSADDLDYGEILYKSPEIPMKSNIDDSAHMCWQVRRFKDEFNVFLSRHINRSKDNILISTFKYQQAAMKFALEMVLICSGKLKRKGLS